MPIVSCVSCLVNLGVSSFREICKFGGIDFEIVLILLEQLEGRQRSACCPE